MGRPYLSVVVVPGRAVGRSPATARQQRIFNSGAVAPGLAVGRDGSALGVGAPRMAVGVTLAGAGVVLSHQLDSALISWPSAAKAAG